MLTLAINSVRVREYPLACKQSWDNGTVSHDFYHALLPKLAGIKVCVCFLLLNIGLSSSNKLSIVLQVKI